MMSFKEWLDEHDEYWDLSEAEQDSLYTDYRHRFLMGLMQAIQRGEM